MTNHTIIQLDNQEILLDVQRKSRFRRLSLRPVKNNEFKLNVPWLIPKRMALNFVREHKAWILKNITSEQSLDLRHGVYLRFLGIDNIRLYLEADLHKNWLLDEDVLLMRSMEEKWIRDFYREQAREHFLQRLAFYTAQIGQEYKQLRIKDTKTRFGSCSSKQYINLSWRLMLLEPILIDYVVWHEVCHLQHMNHSKEFWGLLGEFMPDYKEREAKLKSSSKFLMNYI